MSINTIRLVTIKDPTTKEPKPFAAVLRLGVNGNVVDNWAMGGLIVEINDDATLAEHAFYKPGKGTKTTIHPDTKIQFKGFKIPFYKECVDTCLLFHKKLGIHSIGWDVAITENGPVIIEGNDNWELSLMQVACGPLKSKFNKYHSWS